MKINPGKISDSPWILMPVILVLWGSFAAVSKLTMQGMDSFQLQFYLFGFALAVETVWLLVRGRLRETLAIPPKELLLLLLCGLPSYLYYFLYTLSLRLIPAVEASMLNYLFPVMIVLFAIPINHEKLTLPKLISVVLGFAGMAIMLTGGNLKNFNFSNLAGDLLAIAAAASWGIFSNFGKRIRQGMSTSIWYYMAEAFVLSSASLMLFSRFRLPGPLPLLGVVWLSLSNMVFALPLWIKVMKTMPSALVASLTFITPFITLLFIMLLIGEPLKLSEAGGLLVIVAAIAVQNIKPRVSQADPASL